MEHTGTFEIHLQGKHGALSITPKTYDVAELREVLVGIEDLLYPGQKKDRPVISYDLEEGSVRHLFRTGMQAVIALSAVLFQVEQTKSIDFLDLKTAKVLENLQKLSSEKNYHIELKTSQTSDAVLTITPQTHYLRTESPLVEAEFYFYGEVTNAGGKDKVNVHLDTREYGTLRLETSKDLLAGGKENILYRRYGIRAKGLQNLETGEFDRNSLKFVDFVDYSSTYDADYLDALIDKAQGTWAGVDAGAWLDDIRGYDGV